MQETFRKFAAKIAELVGSSWTFLIALVLLVAWAISGPFFGFSDTWQLIVNTSTTIITFLMVFLIQNTQNRDARIIQLKLDELIRSRQGARNSLINLENLPDEELNRLQKEFERVCHERDDARRQHNNHQQPRQEARNGSARPTLEA